MNISSPGATLVFFSYKIKKFKTHLAPTSATDALGNYFEMRMAAPPGHTYRYATAKQMWTFGFGMSYTQFTYEDLQLSSDVVSASDILTVTVRLTNAGEDMLADEVVQLYVVNPAGGDSDGCRSVPRIELKAFERVRGLAPGGSTVVSLCVAVDSLAVTDHDCETRVLTGQYTLYVGGRQPGTVGTASSYGTPRTPLQATFSVNA